MDQSIVEDLVTPSHILANEGVLDGLGHISVRHPDNPQHYLMSPSLAPALVQPPDIMEYDLDSNAVDRQGRTMFLERFINGETYKARRDPLALVHGCFRELTQRYPCAYFLSETVAEIVATPADARDSRMRAGVSE
jgi:ribulose-5-phosphate 4-epimerase/fuculose-1-phosphate aldolase